MTAAFVIAISLANQEKGSVIHAALHNLLCFHEFSSQESNPMEGEAEIGSTQPGLRLPPYLDEEV